MFKHSKIIAGSLITLLTISHVAAAQISMLLPMEVFSGSYSDCYNAGQATRSLGNGGVDAYWSEGTCVIVHTPGHAFTLTNLDIVND